MTQAIFGLVGVLLGGLITAGIQERQRRIAALTRRKVAARVLHDELRSFGASLTVALQHKNMRLIWDSTALVATWKEQRVALDDLPWEAWNSITRTIVAASFSYQQGAMAAEWDDGFDRVIRELGTRLTSAVKAIEPYL